MQIRRKQKYNLLWVIKSSSSSTRMYNPPWPKKLIKNCHLSTSNPSHRRSSQIPSPRHAAAKAAPPAHPGRPVRMVVAGHSPLSSPPPSSPFFLWSDLGSMRPWVLPDGSSQPFIPAVIGDVPVFSELRLVVALLSQP
jgi:hypothetical protein